MKKWLVALWLVLVVGAQIYYLPKVGLENSAAVGLSATMLILVFPSSILIFVFLAVAQVYLGESLPRGPVLDILYWQLFVVVGYIQWFVLMPRIATRMKQEKSPLVWGILLAVIVLALYGLFRFLFPTLSS